MVLCSICIEMGDHFDEIFEQQLRYQESLKPMPDIHASETETLDRSSSPREFAVPKGYKHHKSYNQLVRSAALGCGLCEVFAYGSRWYSEPGIYPSCSGRILQLLSDLELEGNADPTEQQVYVVGRPFSGSQDPWIYGVAAVEVYIDKRKVFNAARVFCRPGDILAQRKIVVDRPLFARGLKGTVSALGKFWIDKCLKTHDRCSNQTVAALPTRVIDVGPADYSREPFIISPSEGTQGSWAALSHCWGGQILQMSTTKNISEREKSLPLRDLPATFIEAILITRDLGLKYLWIDSLCILQDSTSDWGHEASRMQHVYKYATVTISATMASNSNDGVARHCKLPPPIFPISLNYQSKVLNNAGTLYFRAFRRPRTSTITHFPRGPLTERAWTVQEKVLSTRTLHFGEEELVWDCDAGIETSEDTYADFWSFTRLELSLQDRGYDSYPFRAGNSSSGPKIDTYSRWYQIISEYGVRKLSYARDKLPAIAGVAQQVASRIDDTYCAGMWQNDLHRGLLWTFDGEDDPPERYIAPSWSWASVEFHPIVPQGRRIDFYDRRGPVLSEITLCRPYHEATEITLHRKDDNYDVKILDCSVNFDGTDRYGFISSGFLILEGLCMPAFECGTRKHEDDTFPALAFMRCCIEDLLSQRHKHIHCILDNCRHHKRVDPIELNLNEEIRLVPPLGSDWSASGAESEYGSDDSRSSAHDCRKGFGDSPSDDDGSLVDEGSLEDDASLPDNGSQMDDTSAHGGNFSAEPLRPGSIFIQISHWTSFSWRHDEEYEPGRTLYALLLEPTENPGEYRRRGLASVPLGDGRAVDGWETRRVKVV